MPEPTIEIIKGPLVADWSREAAEQGLQRHSAIAKGAGYALEEVEGRWIGVVLHEAAGPFGGPADETEEAPGPKSEGPDDTTPESEGGSDESSEAPSDGPDLPGEEGGEGGDKPKSEGKEHGLHEVLDIVKQIADALGIPHDLGGLSDGPPTEGGPDGGPPGAGGPPPPPGPPMGGSDGGSNHMGPGGPDVKKVLHEKALGPGQVPPGGTPIGAPAFSSVRPDHPWAHLAGNVASWKLSNVIGEGSDALENAWSELTHLASEINYKVADFHEDRDENNQRVARAIVTIH